MSDFFDRVVARAHGAEPTIQPLTASRYAPPAQRLASPDALAEAHAPADAVAPSFGSRRADAAAFAPAPSTTEPAPDASASRNTPPPPDQRTADAWGSEANPSSGDGPLSGRALSPEAFDEDGVPRRRPLLVASEASRPPVQSPVVTDEAVESRRRDDAGPTSASAAGAKIAGTSATDAAASGPTSSLANARGATGAGREDGPAQRARDLLADIYYGPAEAHATADPAASPTLALGDWNGPEPRGMTARAEPEAQGAREITITIDRIDVRGLAPAPRPEQRGRRGPRLTLADYMRQDHRGRAKR